MHDLNPLESSEIKNVHMIGIGGSSMSGLAEILKNLGYNVTGSDDRQSKATDRLQEAGIKVSIGLKPENIQNPDLVVYTVAVKDDNPELMRARELGVPVLDRAALLGNIMKRYRYGIAISGTHGKTTTTSMISLIMLESQCNPTIHIGGELDAIGGNTRVGGTRYFITEACEYYESFLKFNPYMAVILNIELDHIDYFKDLDHFKSAFHKFASLVPQEGYMVACIDDPNVGQLLEKISCKKITYGIKSDRAVWSARDIVFDSLGCASYTLLHEGCELEEISLNVPGVHNVNNSLAAIAASHTLGCGMESIKNALGKFGGAHKRFELKGIRNNIKVIDDYAHHPSEVKATLKAAKNAEHKKLWCVFQPHTYSRTKAFLNDFAGAFQDADTIIVSDIYAAREQNKGEIHASILAEKIGLNGKEAIYMHSFDTIVDYLKAETAPGDLIITMGAGDISKVGERFLENK